MSSTVEGDWLISVPISSDNLRYDFTLREARGLFLEDVISNQGLTGLETQGPRQKQVIIRVLYSQNSPLLLTPLSTLTAPLIHINLLAFYHECRSLIGYATHYLFNN